MNVDYLDYELNDLVIVYKNKAMQCAMWIIVGSRVNFQRTQWDTNNWKNFQSETPGTKITFCRHSQSQKGNSAIIWKDCFLFGGILILSVKLIMHWETKFNQAMHE